MGLELVSKEEVDVNVRRQAPSEDTTLAYTGTEHRLIVRRVKVDRREMVRFEDKSDRRIISDRRVAQHMWDGRAL
jgi:hypothetical protein